MMRKDSEEYRTMMRVRKMTDAMDKVNRELQGSGLSDERIEAVKKELKYLGKMLKTSDLQTILFISIIGRGCDDFVTAKEISEELGLNSFSMLRMYRDLDVLVERNFISENKNSQRGLRYRMTANALMALRHGRCPETEAISNLSTHELFSRIDVLFTEAMEQEITMSTVLMECDDLFRHNENNPFVRKCIDLKLYEMDPADRLAAFFMFRGAVEYGTDKFSQRELLELMDDTFDTGRVGGEDFLEENSDLFKAGLVEYLNMNGLLNDNVLVLTEFARTRLLKGLFNRNTVVLKEENLIPSDECIPASCIEKKELCYNERESAQMNRLEKLLQEENYVKVLERMTSCGFSRGFTILFHGAPGTGKTAGAFELARRSGRDVWFVDQSKLRSKWYGESEKALCSMFQKYNEAVHQSEKCPILVLNECDSLMYSRIENPESSSDQLSNSMVNTILNELDRFEGILIATSNFTKGIDSAFERRILFKVGFDQPGPEVRKSIWTSKLHGLDETTLSVLAESFDFSGGQIDNVARKANIEYILSGENPTLDSLRAFCDEERLNTMYNSKRRIGYNLNKM